jgi:hypothetical protein
MNNCIKIISFIYIISFHLPAIAQDAVRIKLSMPATTVYRPGDTWFEMTIQLLTDKPIVLPLIDDWGSPEDTTNYIYYSVEKKTGKGYDYYPKTRQPHGTSPVLGKIPDTLSKGNAIKKRTDVLYGFYTFPKGSYRVRVEYYSTVFKPRSIYSKWVYFIVKEDFR